MLAHTVCVKVPLGLTWFLPPEDLDGGRSVVDQWKAGQRLVRIKMTDLSDGQLHCWVGPEVV